MKMPPPRRTLAGAQLVIAHVHGFANWAALVSHIEARDREDSDVARFEAAVDAIVAGDIDGLRRLLRDHPRLVRERSSRSHGATLLHYVSANGVEGFRQKTPPNIVEITTLLIDAGADVNAKAECYGGGDTALGLTATSAHPAGAGVMIPLLETLVSGGADVNRRDGGWGMVRAALANGQPEAARRLAEHGASLELEEAAGVGHLDVVRRFVAEDGTLRNGATPQQLREAFAMGVRVRPHGCRRAPARPGRGPSDEGATGLHWAAYGGDSRLVELLIERGAPVDHRERTHGGTSLEWALYGWGGGSEEEASVM
jgi:ankyrin repeat protein